MMDVSELCFLFFVFLLLFPLTVDERSAVVMMADRLD